MTDIYVVVVVDDRFEKAMVDEISAYTDGKKAQKIREQAASKPGRRAYLQRVWIE